ncbi:hypothetical protein BDZ91DRAFT_334926 [Kalaharituber pfeilii]|nr:hypothetical protein BDZ91DRAFT_334926 [Kalaharituber pfeilii]
MADNYLAPIHHSMTTTNSAPGATGAVPNCIVEPLHGRSCMPHILSLGGNFPRHLLRPPPVEAPIPASTSLAPAPHDIRTVDRANSAEPIGIFPDDGVFPMELEPDRFHYHHAAAEGISRAASDPRNTVDLLNCHIPDKQLITLPVPYSETGPLAPLFKPTAVATTAQESSPEDCTYAMLAADNDFEFPPDSLLPEPPNVDEKQSLTRTRLLVPTAEQYILREPGRWAANPEERKRKDAPGDCFGHPYQQALEIEGITSGETTPSSHSDASSSATLTVFTPSSTKPGSPTPASS